MKIDHTNKQAIHDVLITVEYIDLFDAYSNDVRFTLDGTLNYVLRLLIESCKSNVEYA